MNTMKKNIISNLILAGLLSSAFASPFSPESIVECVVYSYEQSESQMHIATIVSDTHGKVKQWDFPSSYTGHRAVCRLPGATTNDQFYAWIGGSEYVPGDLFGVSVGRDIPQIELTKTSAIIDRINFYTGKSSRHEEEGTPLAQYSRDRVRIVPYQISGSKLDTYLSPSNMVLIRDFENIYRVVADLYVDRTKLPFMSESFVLEKEFDLDWIGTYCYDTDTYPGSAGQGIRLSEVIGDLTMITYRVIIGEGEIEPIMRNPTQDVSRTAAKIFSYDIEKRFEPSESRTSPKVVVNSSLDSTSPVFEWRIDEPDYVSGGFGCTYTAFQIVVANEDGRIVFASDKRIVPALNLDGNYVWEAPIIVGSKIPYIGLINHMTKNPMEIYSPDQERTVGDIVFTPGKYRWQVAMYNAKFQDEKWSDIGSFMATTNGCICIPQH